jgi:hypothetical protein
MLIVAWFWRPVGRLFGPYAFLLFDWCALQTVAGCAALGMALFRWRRREIAWSLFILLSAALPLIILEIAHPSVSR